MIPTENKGYRQGVQRFKDSFVYELTSVSFLHVSTMRYSLFRIGIIKEKGVYRGIQTEMLMYGNWLLVHDVLYSFCLGL